jgi:hypothetical protein
VDAPLVGETDSHGTSSLMLYESVPAPEFEIWSDCGLALYPCVQLFNRTPGLQEMTGDPAPYTAVYVSSPVVTMVVLLVVKMTPFFSHRWKGLPPGAVNAAVRTT